MREIDTDRNGVVDLEEFIAAMVTVPEVINQWGHLFES